MFRRSLSSFCSINSSYSSSLVDIVTSLSRRAFLAAREKTLSDLKNNANDRSIAGGVDEGVKDLVELINTHLSGKYFTTSSCSGRISVFHRAPASPIAEEQQSQQSKAPMKRGAGGLGFLFVSHDPLVSSAIPAIAQDLMHHIRSSCAGGSDPEHQPKKFQLALKFEPVILHVRAADLDSAQMLLDASVSAGLRTSGLSANRCRLSLTAEDRKQLIRADPSLEHNNYAEARQYHVAISASNNTINTLLAANGNIFFHDVALVESLLREVNDEAFPANEERKKRLFEAISKIEH